MVIDFDVGGIEEACDKFLAISTEVHLLCPKISEDDDEDYEDIDEPGSIGIAKKLERIEEHKTRVAIVYRSSLIFGFPEDGAAYQQREFRSRTGGFLQACAHCVRSWHRYRKAFLEHLSEYVDPPLLRYVACKTW
jgi:senataxin